MCITDSVSLRDAKCFLEETIIEPLTDPTILPGNGQGTIVIWQAIDDFLAD